MRTRLAHLPVLAAALVRTLAAYALAKFLAGVRGRNFIVCGILWTTTVPYMNYLFPFGRVSTLDGSRELLWQREVKEDALAVARCRRARTAMEISYIPRCEAINQSGCRLGAARKPLENLAHAQKKHPACKSSLHSGKDVEGCSERFGLSGDRRRLRRAGQCSSSGPAGS